MQDEERERSNTPESPLDGSLHHASATIDDLTLALANFSRMQSPELPFSVTCCCGQEDCENTKAWSSFKTNLEGRLALSAEVGQALLERHEAYVRKHGVHCLRKRNAPQIDVGDNNLELEFDAQERTDALVDELIKEKAELEKRLNRALVDSEVTEVSNNTVLHELHEARLTISRLTAQYARSIGWDTRLAAVLREKDDMQQERDAEAHKARKAESHISALKARTTKLESEVQRLQQGLEERHLHRLESSESVLQEARARLEVLQTSQFGHTAMTEEAEIRKVLESLVSDNEGLKRDNSELQHLLKESREECHALQEEIEEQRANAPSRTGTPQLKSLFLTAGGPTHNRSRSADGRLRPPFESLPPETERKSIYSHSSRMSEPSRPFLGPPQPFYPASRASFEPEEDGQGEVTSPRSHKPLFLLSRSRAVQTDPLPTLSPASATLPALSPSPNDPRSESSSLTDSPASSVSLLVERVTTLLQRMTQADAFTLTNRLKRHHLKGADIGYLSRTTVGAVVAEATALRAQFRPLLEDEKVVTVCTRKDLRGLLKVFKDTFVEMGEMRVTLNDVILDPSIASKVREAALHSTKSGTSTSGGWLAPISKLFGSSGAERGTQHHDVSPVRQEEGRTKEIPGPRVIPKLGPALSASTTTVNVEFSGSGGGRAVTNTVKSREGGVNSPLVPVVSVGDYHKATNVMGIFAGAPRKDPWVVLPSGPSEAPLTPSDALSPTSSGKPGLRKGRSLKRVSRHVDDVIETSSSKAGEESDQSAPLLQRTLRRRGLSDSSIHTTFISQATDDTRGPPAQDILPDRGSVFQTLSQTVKNFRLTTSTSGPGIHSIINADSDAGSSSSHINVNVSGSTIKSAPRKVNQQPRPSSPLVGFLPNFSSWASEGDRMVYVGSLPSESLLMDQSRTHEHIRGHGRDYV